MSEQIFVVTGATGNTGRPLAEALLAKKRKVRVLGRSAAKLKALAAKGAEPVTALPTDDKALAKALQGAAAAYLMIPPDHQAKDYRGFYNQVGEAQAKAVTQAGLKKAVVLSSVGAHRLDGTGPVLGLHDQEQRFNKLQGVDVLYLRPGFFMENHLGLLGAIRGLGVLPSGLKPDLKFAQIAARDIASAAVEELESLAFTGKSARELLGPEDLSMEQTAQVLGAAIGKPDLKYVQAPPEQIKQAMLGMGLGASFTNLILELHQGFNKGKMDPTQPRGPRTSTPTTLKQWASSVFAAAAKAPQAV